MNYLSGTVITQEKAFPFSQFLLKTDYDAAVKAVQKIVEARYSGGILSPSAWRYVGLGGSEIQRFLNNYILKARELKKYITPTTFGAFKNALSEYDGMEPDKLNEWLNAMITATTQGTMPESILKPYNYIPVDAAPLELFTTGALKSTNSLTSKLLTYALIGGIAYGVIVTLTPNLIKTIIAKRR